uniref:Uncharacterized protein n=1 Tax=Ixodes scapularis TaxID=6945 RepID=A0A4D5RC36_IXOSC
MSRGWILCSLGVSGVGRSPGPSSAGVFGTSLIVLLELFFSARARWSSTCLTAFLVLFAGLCSGALSTLPKEMLLSMGPLLGLCIHLTFVHGRCPADRWTWILDTWTGALGALRLGLHFWSWTSFHR